MRSPHTPDYSNSRDPRAAQAALDEMRLNDPAKYELYIRQRIMAEMEASGVKIPSSAQEGSVVETALSKLTPEERETLRITQNMQSIMSKLSRAEQVALGLADPKERKQKPRHSGKNSYMGDITSQLKK